MGKASKCSSELTAARERSQDAVEGSALEQLNSILSKTLASDNLVRSSESEQVGSEGKERESDDNGEQVGRV